MLRPLLGLVAACAVAAPARAADYAWSVGTSGDWADAGRWTPTGTPGAGDNATIAAAGTYTVTAGSAANNVTLNSATATVSGGNFALGGTLTLSAGTWFSYGLGEFGATFTGGTVTRGTGGTGSFGVSGVTRFVNTAVRGDALRFYTDGSLVRMGAGAAFTPGSTVTFSPTLNHAEVTGIVWDQDTVVDNVAINTGRNVQLGLAGGTNLTLGPNAVVNHNDTTGESLGGIGRHFFVPNPNALIKLTNQGTIRNTSGEFAVGRYFGTIAAAPGIDVDNTGTIESRFSTTIHANTFRNLPGGVVRATNGGELFVFALTDWRNQGAFDVGGNGSALRMGGNFKSANVGTITRAGTNSVGFYVARMDNTNATFGVTAATGDYFLWGDGNTGGVEVVGGALTGTGGAKLVVRAISPNGFGYDPVYLTGVQVGPGALRFEGGGHLWLRNGSAFAANETVTLTAANAQLWVERTGQVDDLTVELGGAGNGSSFGVVDDNDLTLGPNVLVRKTGSGTGRLFSSLASVMNGTPSLTNFGTIRVEAGTLSTQSTSEFTNRGLADIAAGATWHAQSGTGLRTGTGGTVRGSGTVTGGLTFTGANTHLRPGGATATGRLTSTGNVTLSSGTTFHARLNGTAAGTAHDQLAVTGTLTLADAALDLQLGYAPGAGDTLFLITNDGTDAVSGTFAGLPEGSTVTVGGYAATVRYAADSVSLAPTGGNDVALVNFTPVPEPGLVLGAAALGLVAWRRTVSITAHLSEPRP